MQYPNQHYVSQFVLRGFHAGSPAQIWAFDKLTGRTFTTAIKDVASEHGFYNVGDSAEIDEVIRKFEHATAPIVEEIRTRKTLRGLDGDKRIWLSGFTALQYVRTKAFSERSQDMMRQITNVVTQMSGGKLSKAASCLCSPSATPNTAVGSVDGDGSWSGRSPGSTSFAACASATRSEPICMRRF